MPLSSSSTPLNPVDQTRNGHINRRGLSAKQSNSIVTTQWPLVTQGAYEQLTRQGVVPPELSNLRLRRLAHARNQLGLTLVALDNCLLDSNPQRKGVLPEDIKDYSKIYNNLRGLRGKLEKGLVGFPLEVR